MILEIVHVCPERSPAARRCACPTFIQANGVWKNTLDYIITDDCDRTCDLKHHPPVGSADQAHVVITWQYRLLSKIERRFHNNKFNFTKGNFAAMSHYLDAIDWNLKFANHSVNECYEIFQAPYNEACSCFIPLKNKTNAHKSWPPWVTSDLKRLSAIKKKLWYLNIASKWKNVSLVNDYKSTRRAIQKLVRSSILNYEKELASDNKNYKRLFAYINDKRE